MSPPCCIKKWRINHEIIIPPKTTLEKYVKVSDIAQVLYKKQTVRKHSDKVKHYPAQWCGWCETTLTRTPSFWCHTRVWVPIVAVGTKNSSVRLCVAYIKLNLQTIKDAYALPKLLLSVLWFFVLDLRCSYYQAEIEEAETLRLSWCAVEAARIGPKRWTRKPEVKLKTRLY